VLRWPRWSAEPFGRRARLPLLWPAGAVVGVAAEWRLYGWADPGSWVPDLLAGWAMIGCGLAGWARRPQSRSGVLLAAAGFAWFVPDFAATGVSPVGWLGAHALYLYRGPLVQLVLTYPQGRVRGRVEGAVVAAGHVTAVVTPVWDSKVGTVALAAVLVAVAVRGYVRAAGGERRMRRSALQATALLAAGAAAIALVRFAVPGPAADAATLLAYEVMLCALAAGLLIGLVRWPWERAEVADLVAELGEARSGTLRDELARALGDPSLQVGYWLPESAAFVDAAGRPLAVPGPGSGRRRRWSSATASRWLSWSTTRRCWVTRAWPGPSPRPPGWPPRTRACRPRSGRAWPRSAPRAGASWRPRMRNAAGWNAGSATARNGGSATWPRRCGWPAGKPPGRARPSASPAPSSSSPARRRTRDGWRGACILASSPSRA